MNSRFIYVWNCLSAQTEAHLILRIETPLPARLQRTHRVHYLSLILPFFTSLVAGACLDGGTRCLSAECLITEAGRVLSSWTVFKLFQATSVSFLLPTLVWGLDEQLGIKRRIRVFRVELELTLLWFSVPLSNQFGEGRTHLPATPPPPTFPPRMVMKPSVSCCFLVSHRRDLALDGGDTK